MITPLCPLVADSGAAALDRHFDVAPAAILWHMPSSLTERWALAPCCGIRGVEWLSQLFAVKHRWVHGVPVTPVTGQASIPDGVAGRWRPGLPGQQRAQRQITDDLKKE
jgi:hypothetical protein